VNVLVTGGAGYIGSHTVLSLIARNHKVAVLDDLSTGFSWAVPKSAQLYVGDVADGALVERIIRDHKIDAVIHFAGSVIVPESVSDPLKYYSNNTVKSRSLIEQCVGCGVSHFIFSSTAAVYGILDAEQVTETAPLNPVSPYGRSKLMTEWMLEDVAAASGLTYAALRYFNVAGADPEGRSGQSTRLATHLIKVGVEAAIGQRPHVDIFGEDYPTPDGTGIRDYIHVSDLAAAHVAALEHLASGGASFVANCGYGKGASVREVLDAIDRVGDVTLVRRSAPRRAGDPARLVADPAKIHALLDWTPQFTDLDQIVAHALAWERALPGIRGKS